MILAGVAVLGLIIMYLLSSYGFIEVSVNGSNGEVTYQLTEVGSSNPTKVTTSDGRIRRLVRKGTYELHAQQGDKHFYNLTDSGGFFGTKKVSGQLETEKGRSFVGNDPKNCMSLAKSLLVSWDCSSNPEQIRQHVPATATLPSYPLPSFFGEDDILEGIVSTSQGNIMLIEHAEVAGHERFEDPNSTPHQAFVLGKGLDPGQQTFLPDLKVDTRYFIEKFRDGFIIVNHDFTEGFYYSALGQPAERIELPKATNGSFKPRAIVTKGDTMAIVYSEPRGAREDNTSDSDAIARQESEVVWFRGTEHKRFDFDSTANFTTPCGSTKLCLLDFSNNLTVYDVSGKALKEEYTLSDVQDIYNYSGGLVIVREDGRVISYNPDNRTGTVQYTLRDYKYCGITPSEDSYAICVVNNKDKKSVLAIDQNSTSDGIDHKVQSLLKVSEVESVSPYGAYIFFTPKLAEPTYNAALGEFVRDPAKTQADNAKIIKQALKIGITEPYQVISSAR